MGANDGSYNRNKKAAEWKTMLAELHEKDPGGYVNFVKIHPGKGHWMNLEDRVAVPWMAKYTRISTPDLVVWKQDDVTHNRFYWLAVHDDFKQARALVRVKHDNQTFTIEHSDVAELRLRVNDDMIDFSKKVTVLHDSKVLFKGMLARQSSTLKRRSRNAMTPVLCTVLRSSSLSPRNNHTFPRLPLCSLTKTTSHSAVSTAFSWAYSHPPSLLTLAKTGRRCGRLP